MEALISVIVPIYNVEKYLERCVNSILNQTYKNIEIILVDDGSPDKCPQICDEYKNMDSRVKVIHKENGGLSDARNYGLSIATGKYVSFVDSDDYIHEETYEKMIKALELQNADIVSCGINHVYDNKIESINIEQKIYDDESAIENLIIGKNLNQTVWNKIYKKNVIDNILFEKGKINEDDFWTYKVFSNSKKIITLNDCLYYYVHRESSIMGQGYSIKNLDGLEARYKQYKFMKDNYPNLVFISKKAAFFYGLFLYQKFLVNKSIEKTSFLCIEKYLENLTFSKNEIKNLTYKERIWIFLSKKSLFITCKIRNLMKIGI